MSEEIFDVVLQSTGHFHASVHAFQTNPPPEDFKLTDEFWVGDLPHSLTPDLVFKACDPAGYNFRPTRQYGMRYAFCRQVRPGHADYYQWDRDLTIGTTLFLSRLIWPTTISNCYAARLYFRDGEMTTVVAGPTQGLGAYAYVIARDDWRDWLSVLECEQLREMGGRYNRDAPDRVRRARKHIDNAFHAYYLDQRFASLVTAFESLLKVSPYKSTKQFESKAPQLAALLGLDLTTAEARAMYEDRSCFVHGLPVSFEEFSDDLIEQYNRFERVLRLALLKASTEPDFAELFSSDSTVTATFGA